MTIERIYLGFWFQRTTLHLRELYEFLIAADGEKAALTIRSRLQAEDCQLSWSGEHALVSFSARGIAVSFTDEGIVLLSTPGGRSVNQAMTLVSDYYEHRLSPLLDYLFRRGAPIPKQLGNQATVYPLLVVAKGVSKQAVDRLFNSLNSQITSMTSARHLDLFIGDKAYIFARRSGRLPETELEELLRTVVFFRDSEEQLRRYLQLHRLIWEETASIRESRNIRLRDFPHIRYTLLIHDRDLVSVRARIEQMKDSLSTRQSEHPAEHLSELTALGMNRFRHLQADLDYIEQLIIMTDQFVTSTIRLLDSLYDENTQRELSALRLVTLFGAIAGFFGMNIAFPWSREWPDQLHYSFGVAFILFCGLVLFQLYLLFFVYNRRFPIRMRESSSAETHATGASR